MKDAEVAPLYKDCKYLVREIKSCLKYSGLPDGTGGKKKKSACNAREPGFDPWVGSVGQKDPLEK